MERVESPELLTACYVEGGETMFLSQIAWCLSGAYPVAEGGGYPEGYPVLIRASLRMRIWVLIREAIRQEPAPRAIL